jgi:hypothetical protein
MKSRAIPLGDIERHFWLTRSVARSIGVNLSEAMAENRLIPEDYTTMVTKCRAEGCHEACQRWLAAQTTAIVDGPPEYCANVELFRHLATTGKRR